jgi:hypothetical protein
MTEKVSVPTLAALLGGQEQEHVMSGSKAEPDLLHGEDSSQQRLSMKVKLSVPTLAVLQGG